MIKSNCENVVIEYPKKSVKVFLMFVFIISVFIDLYNGYVQNIKGSETIIPLVYKGAIILYCTFFIWNNKKTLLYSILFVICYLCCVCYWSISGYSLTIMSLIGDFTRLIYPYVILLYLNVNRRHIDVYIIMKYIIYGCVIAAASIILASLLNIGIASYGDTYGYGTKGFFKAGNDVSLFIILGNFIVSYLITTRKQYIYIIYSVVLSIASMLIGTTAGIVGVGVNYLFLILQPLFVRHQYVREYKIFCWVIIFIGLPLLMNWTIQIINTDEYTLQKFDVERLMTGGARNTLEAAFFNVADTFTGGDYLWGVGYLELTERLGAELRRGSFSVVELNQYEMIGYYGLILGGILLFIPIGYIFRYIDDFLKKHCLLDYWMIIALCVFVGHGLTAGHAYNNFQAMIVVISIMYFYRNRRNSLV